jgi:hypothetical protein
MADLLNTDTPVDAAPTADVAPEATATPVDAGTGNWTDSIPEQYRDAGFVKKYNSQEDFFNGIDNLNKIASSKVVPDFETASPEELNRFRDKLGAPHEAAGYEIQLPENFQTNENFDSFKGVLHKAHVPNDVANELFQMGQAEVKLGIEAFQAAQEQEVDQSFAAFKEDPRFAEIASNTAKMLNKIDPGGEIMNADDLSSLGVNAPKVARLLDRMLTLTGDNPVVKGGNSETTGSTASEDAAKARDDYRAGRISKETADARINQAYARERA